MSAISPPSSPARSLFSNDGSQWSDGSPLKWLPDETVTKIVIGQPPQGDDDDSLTLAAELPADLSHRFPKLTHLYLWRISDLAQLPFMPGGLKCLDVRGSQQLATLPPLPAGLETLVLERCPRLSLSLTDRTEFHALTELSLRKCPGISEEWLDAAVRNCPRLQILDASHCPQLTRLPAWAPELLDVRLDDCENLKALPRSWPGKLRRIGLRGARSIVTLANFPDSLDYVDLAHAESLCQLPRDRGRPRSLFLYGSKISVPPASEHGAKADENVAARTQAYFADVELTGAGEVKRCKLLVLGNGSAGKTCLSLACIGGDPREAERLGTTHGIQFWDWCHKMNVGGAMDDVHLHVWDFGGQEIYHNTHQLFMSKGTVFVVVWKPDQDNRQPDRAGDYQDEWRPLQYWLDFIHLACPGKPRIAIVCSHHSAKTDALEDQWRQQVDPKYRDHCQCFYIDSLHQAGELVELKHWLEDEVGELVAEQGVAVPTYWEIAQDMAEGWVQRLEKDPDFANDHNQLEAATFQAELEKAIKQAVMDHPQRYAKLKACLESGEFELTEDRLHRTLGFLTHSGWIYWDPKLFEGRVIIGQQWALDGLYAILDRRPDSAAYRALMRSDGRFTLAELGAHAWNDAGYSKTDQQLLLTFMQRCGLCFLLRKQEEAWRSEDVYVSFEHLPTAKELRLQREFDTRLTGLDRQEPKCFNAPLLHKQHWQSFLADAGEHYGKDARYALDGFYLENEEGQKLLILSHFDPGGLGGGIEVHVAGPEAAERRSAAVDHVKRFLPGGQEGERPDARKSLGKKMAKQEVFITYAWNPKQAAGEAGIPLGYEEPVNAIETYLQDKPVTLLRDRNDAKYGDNLRNFMLNGASRQHVIVVHSDKYWRSPDCIFELKGVLDELLSKTGKSVLSVLIPVEHLNSNVTDGVVLEEYLESWRSYPGPLPVRLNWTLQQLRDHAVTTMRAFSENLSTDLHLNIRWQDGEAQVLAAIADRLKLATNGLDR